MDPEGDGGEGQGGPDIPGKSQVAIGFKFLRITGMNPVRPSVK